MLNGLLFLLIGLQLRHVLGTLVHQPEIAIIANAALISLTVIIVRLVWVFSATYLPRWVLPGVRARDPYPSIRNVTIVAWTGLRGGISLAAALALPLTLEGGQPFAERDLLVAVTFGVILVTLVGQGLSLIPIIGWLGFATDGTSAQERQRARLSAAQAALARLQDLAGQEWVPASLLADLRTHYEKKAAHANGHLDGTLSPHEDSFTAYQRLHREVIVAERAAVIELRDQGQIDDEALHDIERELDLEELRFGGEE